MRAGGRPGAGRGTAGRTWTELTSLDAAPGTPGLVIIEITSEARGPDQDSQDLDWQCRSTAGDVDYESTTRSRTRARESL